MSTRVLFCDLRTDEPIDVLPVDQLDWDTYVTGKVGTLKGTIPATSAAMGRRCMRLLPARTAVWLHQDDQVVWGGILWTRTPQIDERGRASMPIQAAGFESYLDHRILYETLSGTGVDQLDIARQLVDYAQSITGGDIGIELDHSQVSGVVRDRTYSQFDHLRVRAVLDQLAAVEDGFEWRVHCYRDDGGARHKALQLGYPTITAGSADVVLDYPGPIVSFAQPEDAGGMANAWQSRGASTNQNQATESVPLLSSLLTYPDLIAAGWPRLDGSSDYTTVEVQQTLDEHAAADIARARETRLIPEVTISLQGGRAVPPMGATVRLRIVHPVWYPDGLTVRHRVVGASVRPPARGARPTARLYLEEVA